MDKGYKKAQQRIQQAIAEKRVALDLSSLELTAVPPEIGQLTKLQSLYLSNNQLTAVPSEIGQLTKLQTLYLSNNQLTAVPPEIGQLTGLQSLYLSNNQLTAVPPEIGQLTDLQKLNLGGNRLTAIPLEIGHLTVLKNLWLYNNQLEIIPEWWVQMTQLRSLRIIGNPINQPPPELFGEALTIDKNVDLEAVQRYYAQLAKEGEATIYEAKLLLIGEGSAGKTSLARKLMDTANPLPSPDDSTKGIDVHPWHFALPPDQDLQGFENLEGLDYQANIWDFGGQAIYKNTHQFFLSKRSVYVLLTDTRRESDFYDWLRMQEAFGADSPILILKNQNRRHGNQCIIENLPQLQERFPNMQEIVQLDLSGVPDKENEAWADFLRYLQRHLLNLDHIGKPIPRTWVAVRNALNEDTRNSISRSEYLTLCAEQGIDDPADALQLSQFLHDIGDILHYQTDPGPLANLIILDPTWALDAVYRILDNKQISDEWGQFSYHQLCALWNEPAYATHQDQLLALMRRFQLCYQLPQKRGHYIAPQMLKPEVPAYEWEAQSDDLQLRFHYPHFMPRGILSRAVVVLHEYIEEQQLVWRSGAILKNSHARAELLELRGEKEIRIRIGGKRKRDFLMEIVRELDKLHEGFSSKLNYEKLVPCRCERCMRLRSNPQNKEPITFFKLEYLRARLASPNERKHYVDCDYEPFDDVHVRNLIDDAILQMDQRGSDTHHHYYQDYIGGDKVDGDKVGGDQIQVGDISDAQDVAIGTDASASASS